MEKDYNIIISLNEILSVFLKQICLIYSKQNYFIPNLSQFLLILSILPPKYFGQLSLNLTKLFIYFINEIFKIDFNFSIHYFNIAICYSPDLFLFIILLSLQLIRLYHFLIT